MSVTYSDLLCVLPFFFFCFVAFAISQKGSLQVKAFKDVIFLLQGVLNVVLVLPGFCC